MANQSISESVLGCAEQAVDFAKKQYGVNLDYSEGSIQEVEKILGNLHDTLPKGIISRLLGKSPSQEQISDMAMIWGCYLGEVIRRRWGGEWTNETAADPRPVVTLRVLGSDIFPPAKAFKRITNGSEDNVWFYYNILRQDFAKSETAE